MVWFWIKQSISLPDSLSSNRSSMESVAIWFRCKPAKCQRFCIKVLSSESFRHTLRSGKIRCELWLLLVGYSIATNETTLFVSHCFYFAVPYGKTAKILILMSIPGQIVFIFVADAIHMGQSTLSALFVFSYIFVSFVQVIAHRIELYRIFERSNYRTALQICLLLYIAHVLIHAMWRWKIDPDNSAIPYLTALGDLFGSMFLALAFLFIQSVGFGYGEETDV